MESKAQYLRSFSNSLSDSNDESLHALGRFDEYRSEEAGNRFIARFRQSDDALVFFSVTDERKVDGTLTEQDAKVLADALLVDRYGDQFAAEYSNCEIVVTNDDLNKIITVGYTKYIYGYPTTDRVLVTYNMRGELKAFNAMTKGIFDSAEASISIDEISNAEEALISVIPPTAIVGTKMLTLDADGDCYLYVTTTQSGEGLDQSIDAVEYYINIDV